METNLKSTQARGNNSFQMLGYSKTGNCVGDDAQIDKLTHGVTQRII